VGNVQGRSIGIVALVGLTIASAAHGATATPRTVILDANALAMHVSNVGSFAYELTRHGAGLEYPAGSGHAVAYAGGLWLAGRIGGTIRTTVAEFTWTWSPGPIVSGMPSPDSALGALFTWSVDDTSGRAAWTQRAMPLGAPSTPPGDRAVWSVFNDADRTAVTPRWGMAPIGVEAQLLAYAWDRPGALARTVFLAWTIIAKGGIALDSARAGVFLDPKAGTNTLLAAWDSALALGYSYRANPHDDEYGAAGPAIGITLLDVAGPPDPRPAAFTVYPNGADPADSLQILRALTGVLPWGAPMVDPIRGEASAFWSTGDPVTGTGWVADAPIHPHSVLAASPATLAPGDTLRIHAALVVGQGPDRLASVTDLRASVTAVRRLYAGLDTLPAPVAPRPGVRAWPNPTSADARFEFVLPFGGGPVTLDVFDPAGRLVRHLWSGPLDGGRHRLAWDGRDDDGRAVPAGIYLVHAAFGGRTGVTRIAILR
jgi:hypothetical protein